MLFKEYRLRSFWLLTTIVCTLGISGCSDSDSKVLLNKDQIGTGAMFHGAEWATIKDLDPRGEECVQCHGRSPDLSPNGGKGHNIGLKNNTDHSAYSDLKITGVKIDEATGEVTVTLNQAIPDNAGALSMTFAKLAPRVIHNRGHDWQNYFMANTGGPASRNTGMLKADANGDGGGAHPQVVPNPSVNGKTITFNLGNGAGRSWGKHDFTVKSAYAADSALSWEYEQVLGTKFASTTNTWNIKDHVYCDAAHANANQIEDNSSNKSVCWWPDGTHLTSGVFVTEDDEFVVAYDADQTHRVTIILAGSPGFNTWFDFVPSVANGKNPATLTAAGTTLTGSDYIEAGTGRIIAENYALAEGNRAPGGTVNNDTQGHQNLPAAREVVDIQSCNSCHDSLTMHGTARAQTQVCVTCHNPGNLQVSSGRSVDFKQLIHRIHRGVNLPSEDAAIAPLMHEADPDNAMQTGKLLSAKATDFTKVRFPQGPTPGTASGITNCVKCHIGESTLAGVNKLAEEIGAGVGYNAQEKLKLAKITPQGDNWLNVRSVNACQACHDSNIWFSSATGDDITVGGRAAAATIKGADKILPFYSDKYSGIGFEWMGKKLAGVATSGGGGAPQVAGWVHNQGTPNNNGRFTCGSGGGCHGVTDISDANNLPSGAAGTISWGSRTGSHAVERMHLQLTRDFIIADRFDVQVKDVNVDATGFNVKVEIIDKRDGTVVTDPATHDANLGAFTLAANGMFGWMANGSPDYNHSAGGGFGANYTTATPNASGGQPGSPAGLRGITFDTSSGEGTMSISWADIEAVSGIHYDFANDFDKATSFGTVAINANLAISGTNYRLRSANKDFSFATGMLADGELARRQVVDFSAGSGNDANRDRYAGWDKEHGSNTQSCSSCHLKLDMHGATASNNTQMCVICHNPNVTDLRARTKVDGMVILGADGQYEESEDFKRLIHGVHAAAKFRIDPLQTRLAQRPSADATARGQSFPGVLSNCKACHIETEPGSGKWTFELDQLPAGQIGSTVITGDWASVAFDTKGGQHNLDNHMKMSPITSVCSSCHDAGYKTSEGRMNNNILDGGPYVGSHWWVMGGIAPGIVRQGEAPNSTKHQSGL